jgi:serine/threonine-protein kinase
VVLVLLLAALAGGAGWWFGSGPGSQVGVPDVSGRTLDEATTALAAEGLTAVPAQDHSRDVPVDLVIRTDPGAGARVDKNSAVNVIISLGPASHDIPALAGQSLQAATTSSARSTSLLGRSDADLHRCSRGHRGERVDHPARRRRRGGLLEGLHGAGGVDRGVRDLRGARPDVAGKTVDAATAALSAVDLNATTTQAYDDEVAEGRVIRIADKDGGAPFRPGDTVTLVVSKGPQPIPSPT